jgi:hypothetical protein
MYADETYLHSSHTTFYAWDDGSGAGLKAPISKGRRLIIYQSFGSGSETSMAPRDFTPFLLTTNSRPGFCLPSAVHKL